MTADPVPSNVVFHDQKLILMLSCKAGSTSIRKAFARKIEAPYRIATRLPPVDKHGIERLKRKGYLVLANVRNPYTRVASCWVDKIEQSFYRPFKRRYGRYVVRAKMPFAEWIGFVSRTPDAEADQHFRSMSYDLVDEQRLLPDVVFKIEDTNWWQHFRSAVEEHCGLNLGDELRLNTTNHYYSSPYDVETRELVEKRYTEDFTNFGYAADGGASWHSR